MKKLLALSTIFLLLITCDTNPLHSDKADRPVTNQPPETYLFLFTNEVQDTTSYGIDTTASKQSVYWWGEDRDGQVIGYYYQWNYQSEKTWTTAEKGTFYVPIKTLFDKFTFKVWAVDNDSLIDPTPAVQVFPVFNSFPEISFKNRSNPPAPPNNPNVTAYTFPTRTFMWDVNDPDGIETIEHIYYALDDTSSWQALDGTETSVTLINIPPGEHTFFLKARDIAGAESDVISFPDLSDDSTPNTWVVREPIGDVLLVNDYALDQNTHLVQDVYESMLNEIVGSNGYSVWEIGTNVTPPINPQNSLPYASADIKAYFGYFKKIIWFSHLGRPNLSEAGLSLTQYIANGGNVFITNGNATQPDTSWTFTNIDSTYILNPNGRLLAGVDVNASFDGDEVNSTLDLTLGKLIGNRVSALVPGSAASVVYKMQPDSSATIEVPYKGSPAVGIRYVVGSGKSIYFSLPLHYCDGRENLTDLLRYIIEVEFE